MRRSGTEEAMIVCRLEASHSLPFATVRKSCAHRSASVGCEAHQKEQHEAVDGSVSIIAAVSIYGQDKDADAVLLQYTVCYGELPWDYSKDHNLASGVHEIHSSLCLNTP